MQRPYVTSIISGVIGSLLAMALYFSLEYASGKSLEPASRSLILALGGGIAAFALAVLATRFLDNRISNRIRPQLEAEVRERLEKEIRGEIAAGSKTELESLTGITAVYANFPECQKEILDHFESSSSIRIFVQIGKTVLSGSKIVLSGIGTMNFYDYLGKVIQPNAKVRILHASAESPYLSRKVASERGSEFEEWITDLEYAKDKVKILGGKPGSRVESRQHKEGYVWRLFIFDEFAYVQPYLYEKENGDKAPVLKLSRYGMSSASRSENPKSLYRAFSKYFDFKWDECSQDATHRQDQADLVPNDAIGQGRKE